jgi:hypothetical protein
MTKRHVLLLLVAVMAGALLVTGVSGQQESTQRPTAQIRGYLLEEGTRKPVTGGVNWAAGRRPGEDLNSGVVEAKEDGSFTLLDLPHGPIALVGWAGGYGSAFTLLMTTPGKVAEVELLLPVAAAVEGKVVDSRGYPISNARVRVRYLESFSDRIRTGRGKEAADLARAQGFRISIQETSSVGGWPNTGASEGKEAGVFRLLGIDPARPFVLIVSHETFGRVESETLVLVPGQELEGVVLSY